MMTTPPTFWLTGLSGSGKSTLGKLATDKLKSTGYKTLFIDGDIFRNQTKAEAKFDEAGIKKNGLNLIHHIKERRDKFDAVIVASITPYEETRKLAQIKLEGLVYFFHISCDLDTLKARDIKGLYRQESDGIINNLIGVSKSTPYEVPANPVSRINTSSGNDERKSLEQLLEDIYPKLPFPP